MISLFAFLLVFVDDFLQRPQLHLQRILSFVNLKDNISPSQQIATKYESYLLEIQQTTKQIYQSQETLSSYQQITQETIESEFVSSSNLTKWPCLNFASLESSKMILPHLRYYQLSPDCSNPVNTCSVQYDFKEQPPQQKQQLS